MKKLFNLALISSLSFAAQADFQLTVKDSNGENKHCISSYSFSNNLESVLRNKVTTTSGQDVYSTAETKTNKIWKGKPVYRKIVELGNLSHLVSNSNGWQVVPFNIDNIDEITDADVHLSGAHQHYSHHLSNSSQLRYAVGKTGLSFVVSSSFAYVLKDVDVVLEYTKTTDQTSTPSTPEVAGVKNFIHYALSSAPNNVVTTVTDGKTISIEPGYQYNANNSSCEKQ